MKERIAILVVVATVYYAAIVNSVNIEGCNEAQCATNVSKCQLIGACGCTLENCSCCANCSSCLKHQWDACCPCVGLCKLPNITHDFSSVSTIGNLKQTAIPSLFESLVESALMGDFDLEVSVYKVSHEEEDISLYRPPSLEGQAGMGSLQVNSSTPAGVCSLIFHDQCTALEKCRRFCSSVGASRYRWFHTACCECIGDTCISYGVNESLCRDCRPSQE